VGAPSVQTLQTYSVGRCRGGHSGADTVKVTGIDTTGAVPEVGVNVILPVYVWGFRLPGVAVTFTDPGVPAVPVANVSHDAFEFAVQPRLVPLGLVNCNRLRCRRFGPDRIRKCERC
jgi:hypothetical protein